MGQIQSSISLITLLAFTPACLTPSLHWAGTGVPLGLWPHWAGSCTGRRVPALERHAEPFQRSWRCSSVSTEPLASSLSLQRQRWGLLEEISGSGLPLDTLLSWAPAMAGQRPAEQHEKGRSCWQRHVWEGDHCWQWEVVTAGGPGWLPSQILLITGVSGPRKFLLLPCRCFLCHSTTHQAGSCLKPFRRCPDSSHCSRESCLFPTALDVGQQ